MGVPNLAGHATTWTEYTSATGATATATKAAVSGESHYITGFMATASSNDSARDTLTLTVYDDSTAKIVAQFEASFGGAYAPGGNPIIVDLSNPLKITHGKACSASITGAATGTTASVNIWGFTLDD